MNQQPKLLFMGTPEFAVASLHALVKAGYNISGVVTAPDKPAGRGRILKTSPVKDYATRENLPLFQPEKMKSQGFLHQIRELKPELIIVVAFRMLPEEVWNLPPMGTINLHASLLPQYRGAAPINWAIINGENTTGVTTFFIEKTIDTGRILLRKSIPISVDENAGTLHDRLMNIGADLLIETVRHVIKGDPPVIIQSKLQKQEGQLMTAPKIFPADCRINWDQGVSGVYNHIRGLSPYPAAWTYLKVGEQSKVLKILSAEKEEIAMNDAPGAIIYEESGHLLVACRDGYIHIKTLQLEGKKQMQTGDFLRGIQDPSTLLIEG